jgi:hypothetical protein
MALIPAMQAAIILSAKLDKVYELPCQLEVPSLGFTFCSTVWISGIYGSNYLVAWWLAQGESAHGIVVHGS